MTDADESSDADAPVGLRERRRRATSRELADAAIDLFEQRGVHGTTVDDIAAAAGVSPRTFFRYAEKKEGALFLDDEGSDDVLEHVRTELARGAAAAEALQGAWSHLLAGFDAAGDAEHARSLRVRRLIFSEPSLLAVALEREARHGEQLVAAIRTASPALDELSARALVTTLGTSVRLAFDEWARRAEAGTSASVRDLHDQIQVTLHDLLSR